VQVHNMDLSKSPLSRESIHCNKPPPYIVALLQCLQVQKSKAGTGRVVGFRELGLVNAFTMEASFAGAAVGKYAKQHFNTGG